jgi:hypothetical protein
VTDPVLRLLANLPQAEPEKARAARVRSVCHAALARQQRPTPRPRYPVSTWEALVAGLAGIYLTETIRQVSRLFGIL